MAEDATDEQKALTWLLKASSSPPISPQTLLWAGGK